MRRRCARQWVVAGVVACMALSGGRAWSGEDEAAAAPRQVAATFKLIDIPWIDERTQQFLLQGYLALAWQDTSLALPADAAQETRDFAGEEVWAFLKKTWNPVFELVNAASPPSRELVSLEIEPDGTVRLEQKIECVLFSAMDFHAYPFDRQALRLCVESYMFDTTDLVFVAPEDSAAGEPVTILPKTWRLTRRSQAIAETVLAADDRYSRQIFLFHVERNYSHYLWRVILPLGLILALSWAVFAMGAGSLAERIMHIITCLLASIALNFLVGGNLPDIPHLCQGDCLFLVAYISMALAALEAVVVHHLEGARPALMRRVDMVAFVVIAAGSTIGLGGLLYQGMYAMSSCP